MSSSDIEEIHQIPVLGGMQPKSPLRTRSSVSSEKSEKPWVEKFRPKSLGDVFHQDVVVASLRQFMSQDNMPHLLFYGPPGVGKTTTILALCRELFGKQFSSRVLELNASNERGIDVIRGRVKDFARQAAPPKLGRGIPGYKFIILDEADAMTPDAQSALRRTMEKYVSSTRICLVCNYPSRIIPPIISRCARFRFSPVPTESAHTLLRRVAQAEHCGFSEETLDRIAQVSRGDLRRAINLLQSLYMFVGEGATADDVDEICGSAPKKLVNEMYCKFMSIVRGSSPNVIEQTTELANAVIQAAIPAIDILLGFSDHLMEDPNVSPAAFAQISRRFASNEQLIIDGSSEFLALLDGINYAVHMIRVTSTVRI